MYLPVKFLIFDLDGTILDTESIFLRAYGKLLSRYDKPFPKEAQLKCIGKNKQTLHEFLIKEFGIQNRTIDELADEGAAIQHRIYESEGIELMPGVRKFVHHMASHHVQMAIATASPKSHVNDVIKNHIPFFHLFDHIVSGEKGIRSKPFPDLFLLSARRIEENPNPKDFLVFEDTPSGVQAGIAAGMQVVMIPHPLIPKDQQTKATKVIPSFDDFVPEEFGLPPYDSKNEEECVE